MSNRHQINRRVCLLELQLYLPNHKLDDNVVNQHVSTAGQICSGQSLSSTKYPVYTFCDIKGNLPPYTSLAVHLNLCMRG